MNEKTRRGMLRRYSHIFRRGCKCEECGWTGDFGPLHFYVDGQRISVREWIENAESVERKIDGAKLLCLNCLNKEQNIEEFLKTVCFS